jgi:hypothetical protein
MAYKSYHMVIEYGIIDDSRGFTGMCVVVAQEWCTWLVWT